MLSALNLRHRETNWDFQRMSSLDAASHLHITWESIVQLHILSRWMCSAHFPVGRTAWILSQQCVLFHLRCLFTCLLAYLLFAFSLPCSWFWALEGEWTIPAQTVIFTNKSLSLQFLHWVYVEIPSSLSLFLNLMKFSKGPCIYLNKI